jgi:hypothetical protein
VLPQGEQRLGLSLDHGHPQLPEPVRLQPERLEVSTEQVRLPTPPGQGGVGSIHLHRGPVRGQALLGRSLERPRVDLADLGA